MSLTRWPLYFVAATALALCLRLWGLASHGAWFDEAYYAYLATTRGPVDAIKVVLASPPSAPLYAILLDGWVALTGASDVAIRLPSVMAGAATVPVTAWLAWEMTRRRSAALLAAVLVAISPFAVQLSQEARPYALGALTLTAALAAQWHWRRSARDREAAIAIVLAIVAVHAHYLSAAALALTFLVPCGIMERRRWMTGHGLVVLAWSPWLIASLAAWMRVPLRTDIASPANLESLVGTFVTASAGTGALREGWRPLEVAGLLVGGALLVLGWRYPSDALARARRVLLATALAVVIFPVVVSALTGRWLFSPAFVGLVIPMVLVGAAAGVVTGNRRPMAVGILTVWLAIQGVGLVVDRGQRWHDDDSYREIAATIDGEAAPTAVVLVTPPILVPGVAHYSDRPLTSLPTAFDPALLYRPTDATTSARATEVALEAFASDPPAEIWLVYRPEEDRDGRLLAGLQQTFAEAAHWTYDVADLFRFVRADAPR